jgi:hypothetical protein
MTIVTGAAPEPVQNDAGSDATRLMCAGVYSDPVFRDSVIAELKTNWFRKVAPSYGYDAVPVLAHALAARRLRAFQVALTAAGGVLVLLFMLSGIIGFLDALMFFAFVAWALSFVRRLAALEVLATRLRSEVFTGAYPQTPGLTREVVDKITYEQSVDDVVYYGGYKPFVGAGAFVKEWSNAQLLVPAPVNPLIGFTGHQNGEADAIPGTGADQHGVKRFSVEEITAFMERRLLKVLRDDPDGDKKMQNVTIERPKYRKMVGFGELPQDGSQDLNAIHWREEYNAAREYLCVRVGSWNQELVTSIFVGFDLKGDTLHTEFHTYVLAPINAGYHLVDRLPEVLGGPVVARAAWDALKAVLADALAPVVAVLGFIGSALSKSKGDGGAETGDRELNLPAYARRVADRGSVSSVREMASSARYHHFFQQTDASKYIQIVERRVLECIEVFLREHNVDLADHTVFQSTILGDVITHHGSGHISSRNSGVQTQGDRSSIKVQKTERAKSEKPA